MINKYYKFKKKNNKKKVKKGGRIRGVEVRVDKIVGNRRGILMRVGVEVGGKRVRRILK
jgi:hypothetical protein